MRIFRHFIILLIIIAPPMLGTCLSPAFAASKAAPAKASSWDGTWSGRSSAGRQTTVKISGGKVTFWTNNGFPRPKVTGSVSGSTVRLNDNNGWTGTITLQGNGTARLSAGGIGMDGKPAKNTTLLTKR
jgi:hypothetical protein